MLKGMIVYKGVTIKLIARATMNDIRLYLYNDKIDDNYEKMVQLFDNWGDDEKPYYTDDFRRLDVQLQKNSFKTNLRNVEMSAKIAGMIKYAVAHCDKVKYAEKEADFTSDTVKMIYNTANELAGKVKFSYGIVQEIVVRNECILVSIKYEPDDVNEDVGKIFGELKVKDDYGNILSKTPVINKAYKLNTDLLGNLYTHVPVQHNSSVEGVVGLYATLEEVKRAHPEKNFAWIDDKKYYIVEDENLEEIIADFMKHDGWIAFDTETSGLNITFKSRTGEADQLVGVVLSKEFGTSYYFPLQHKAIKNLCNGDHFFFMEHYMRDLLEKKDIVMHNTNFDWKVAYIYDINIHVVYDTQFAVGVTKRYEVENYAMGLKQLEKIFFGIDAFELSDFVDGEWGENDIRFWDLPYEYVRQYACPDADYTLGLALHFKKIGLVEQYDAQRVFELEIQFAKVVAYSEFWGYHIDIDNIPTMHDEIVKEMAKQKQAMFDMVGYEFNPNSPVQLCKAMYDDLGIELIGGKRSTSKDVLKALSSRATENGEPKYPFVHALKAYRKAEGTYKNFLKKLDKEVCAKEKLEVVATDDGYIFPEVYQLGTNTGRCSIKNPNYQSYNDIVKKYIIPRPGFMMVDSDFAQIEYRVLASMAGQQTLIEAFNDPDLDYHTYQASRMHNVPYASVTKQLRQQSKGINFGLPYGMADPALGAAIFGEKTPENTKKAAALRKKFFEGQERIENLFATVRSQGVAKGYTSTWLGRRRYYQKGKFDEGAIRRQAGNHVIQGCNCYDTLIQTKEYGIVKIGDVVGEQLHIWDGDDWTIGTITYSGKKRKCIVHFKGGQSYKCSPDHKFKVRSHKGNDSFVRCEDLIGSRGTTSRNGHRVVVNPSYMPSDCVYTSEPHYHNVGVAHNANNFFIDSLQCSSFEKGVVLGRLASDGYYPLNVNNTHSCVRQIVAEHEQEVADVLCNYMTGWKPAIIDVGLREGRKEKLTHVQVHSHSLVKELQALDLRHIIHPAIFADTEMLRGYLRGFFDGDGGISGKTIVLTQGTHYDFEPLMKDIQKALLFFGVRSRYRKYDGKDGRYVLQIKTTDNARFLERIGFISSKKQTKGEALQCVEDEHIFGKCLLVDYVEVTDEYVDMYDVCNTERGYYVADGVITHNSAADIYKTAVVRLFNRIEKEGLLGKILFLGFIHDELLTEVHNSIDPYYFMQLWREEYQLQIDGFCRLFAGIGFGYCWYDAKKKDLPPQYVNQIISEYENGTSPEWDGNHKAFIDRVYTGLVEFEHKRVIDYVQAEESQGQVIAPVISSLLHDIVEDETNEELNVKVGYEAKEGGFKDIQKNLMIFCELYGIDYNAIDVRTPEETDASGGNDSSQGEVSEVTRTYIDMVKDMLLLNNYFLDTELNRLFLNAPDEVWGKLSSLIQMYGFKDKDNEHTGYSIYMYMEGSKLGKPVPKGEKDFGGIPFKIKGENLTQFFENLPYVYA